MDDIISRQAAIDALEREKTYCRAYRDGYSPIDVFEKYNAGLADGIKALKKLPSAQPEPPMSCDECPNFNKTRKLIEQPEQRWIPVSERLPEHDGDKYLVTDYCKQIGRTRMHVSYCYINREGFWSDVPLGYEVVAWQRLPDPWKGEA